MLCVARILALKQSLSEGEDSKNDSDNEEWSAKVPKLRKMKCVGPCKLIQ